MHGAYPRGHGFDVVSLSMCKHASTRSLSLSLSCHARACCVCARIRFGGVCATGGSWHTSSGGFPSHVPRGENVPPAGRKGR